MGRHIAFDRAQDDLLKRHGIVASSRYIDVAGQRIHVLEIGTGSPVLFIHGGGGAAIHWIPLVAALREVRAVLVDRPGHGLSERFDYRGVDLRAHAASFVTGTMDALGLDRVPVVANSMGGTWALWSALATPRRIESLTLMGCPAFLLGTGAPRMMRFMSVPGLNRLLLAMQPANARGTRMMWQFLRADLRKLTPEFLTASIAVRLLPSGDLAWRTLLENCLRAFGPLPYDIGEEELRRIGQPTLFIWGTRDPFGPPALGRRAAAVMPNARVEIVEEGHLPWLDDPARTAQILRGHLKQTPSDGASPDARKLPVAARV